MLHKINKQDENFQNFSKVIETLKFRNITDAIFRNFDILKNFRKFSSQYYLVYLFYVTQNDLVYL